MITHDQMARQALNVLIERPGLLDRINKVRLEMYGVQVCMGDSIIGQWINEDPWNPRYESYGKKKPRYLKIAVREFK